VYDAWVAYLFSWFGAVYDLFIAFFLLNRRTRLVAYGFVIIFHVATAIFFPGIGMFPYVMILCSLVFFSSDFHKRLLSFIPLFSKKGHLAATSYQYHAYTRPVRITAVLGYIHRQIIVPFRFLLYPGHLFWHEEGYRFSWRVMLMEKSGVSYFTIKDKVTGEHREVTNAVYLTPFQEKMMSTQPDMILKYAHFLAEQYKKRGMKEPEVYGEVYVSLNGQRSRLFIDSTVDLAKQHLSWGHYSWVLPYKN
jgi:hypothetical protein